MEKQTIKHAFLVSFTVVIIGMLLDTFVLKGNLLTRSLGIVFAGYLGSVVFVHKKNFVNVSLMGGLLGILLGIFFYTLVILGFIPVPEELQSKFSNHSQTWILSIYVAASFISGISFGIYSLIGAFGAKLFWKSKTGNRK